MEYFNNLEMDRLDIGIRKFLNKEFLIYYSESLNNEE